MRRASTLILLLALLTLGAQAEAVLITYSSQATFLAATGATSATGPLPNAGAVGLASSWVR